MKNNYCSNETPDGHVEEKYEELTSIKALKYFVIRDLSKIHGEFHIKKLLKSLLIEPGFKFVFWLRVTRYLYLTKKHLLFLISRFILKHYSYKYEFDVTYRTPIGPGLSIAHIGYIVVGAESIGSNCFLRPGVVIGRNLIGDTKTPVIGDNVHFGVGCKVTGNVKIRNNVILCANSVVTRDVPSNTIYGGIPAKHIKELTEIVKHPTE